MPHYSPTPCLFGLKDHDEDAQQAAVCCRMRTLLSAHLAVDLGSTPDLPQMDACASAASGPVFQVPEQAGDPQVLVLPCIDYLSQGVVHSVVQEKSFPRSVGHG